jgi:hypothetical protein
MPGYMREYKNFPPNFFVRVVMVLNGRYSLTLARLVVEVCTSDLRKVQKSVLTGGIGE